MTIPLQKFPIITSATQLFDFYKIPWRRTRSLSSYEELPPTWDGKYVNIDWKEEHDSVKENIAWSFHEVSHYLFAPEDSRKIPNYGLGTDPAGGGKSTIDSFYIRGGYAQSDEEACCILDIFLMSLHGQKEDDVRFHMRDYGMTVYYKHDIELIESAGFNASLVKTHIGKFIYEIG